MVFLQDQFRCPPKCDPKAKMFSLQFFLRKARKGASSGYVGSIQNLKDLKDLKGAAGLKTPGSSSKVE